jgi:hypothetical protein
MTKIYFFLVLNFTLNICFAQKSQNEIIKTMENGSYSVYKKVDGRGYNVFKFEKATKQWPVEFFKEGDICPKILIKKVGILDEYYEGDLPKYPAFYYGGNEAINVSVLDGKIYYYLWSSKTGAKISYILTNKSVNSFTEETELLTNYRRTILAKQTAARDERKDDNKALELAEKEANTLEGKEIKSIRLKKVDSMTEYGLFSVIQVGIEVELKDGKVLKTKNLGGKTPYADFVATTKSGDYAGGDFKVFNDSKKIQGHKIEIEVSSKWNTAIKGNFELPLNYKSDVYYSFLGYYGKHNHSCSSGGDGGNGQDASVQVTSKTVNGEPVNEIMVQDSKGHTYYCIIHIEKQLYVNCYGGSGGNADSGSNCGSNDGGSGGDGGDVSISGSGVDSLKIVVKNQGGKGGEANGLGRRGSYGSAGSQY